MSDSAPDALEGSVSAEIDVLSDVYDTSASHLEDLPDAVLFKAASAVSDWSPAQHLYHIWRANASMLKAARVLAAGRVDTETPNLTEQGRWVLQNGRLPRGVAEAPDAVRPPETLDRPSLREMLERSLQKLADVESASAAVGSAEGGLEHPAWGVLTAAQWVRAARVHSEHHAAIMDDILDGPPS